MSALLIVITIVFESEMLASSVTITESEYEPTGVVEVM
ncbi:unannotated protein [freshwater metagenome]|uniref:Unannotated protein n=1 Tax=freshwater metagenome TaxID=449393 RepID=A0A6J7KN93_9ZZZZ